MEYRSAKNDLSSWQALCGIVAAESDSISTKIISQTGKSRHMLEQFQFAWGVYNYPHN
jgi:hypothetical protein